MRGRDVFGGLFLIFLGILFLLNNFGILSWDIWRAYLDYWPLVLIALGLRLIFKDSVIIQILVLLLIFAVPLAIYFYEDTKPRIYSPWVQEAHPRIKESRL